MHTRPLSPGTGLSGYCGHSEKVSSFSRKYLDQTKWLEGPVIMMWPVASVQPRASNEVVVQVLVFALLVLTLPAVLLATEILFYFGTIYIDTKLLGKL